MSELDFMVFTAILDGEALAALGTTTSQHGTTALGGHASAEPVALRAFASVRLISAFHNHYLSNCENRASARVQYPPHLSQ